MTLPCKPQDPIDWKSVQNQVSNENALNEKLRDDRGTNAAALNDAAAEAERRMQACLLYTSRCV